jgi:ribosome-binding factor A
VSPDHAHAKVFFTTLGDAARIQEALHGLSSAAGFLRSELARRVRLRTIPHLQFAYDNSVAHGAELSRLIDEAVGGPKTTPDA